MTVVIEDRDIPIISRGLSNNVVWPAWETQYHSLTLSHPSRDEIKEKKKVGGPVAVTDEGVMDSSDTVHRSTTVLAVCRVPVRAHLPAVW